MADEKKKFSFGFSKSIKKPNIIPAAPSKPAETIEFIKCVEDNSIKVFNEVKEEEIELVIPMKSSRQIGSKPSSSKSGSSDSATAETKPQTPDELAAKQSSSNSGSSNSAPAETKPQTLDELAAKEIVAEVNRTEEEEKEADSFAVPLVSNPPTGEKESTLEDYESIPIEKFGNAMLRGMGWEPGKGIGKNPQIAPTVTQVLRPKGMGLGADKAVKATQAVDSENKELKLCIGSCVRLVSGANKDNYGKVEGFIEESGRVIVKLARGGDTVIVGEFTLSVVTPEEYSMNSKVLNIAKYEKYKSNEKTIDERDSEQNRGNDVEYSERRSQSHSSKSSHRSYGENGSSRNYDRHSSKDDRERYRDRSSSRKDHDSKRYSDHRSDRSDHHRSSSKKHGRDRSPRRK